MSASFTGHMTKSIPEFKSEDEEREFWATHSPLDYFDTSKAHRAIFPNLKPSLKSISLRLPEIMIEELKVMANRRDVPYQSLVKMFLAKQIEREQAGLLRKHMKGRERKRAA